ncbi:hypothetical protein [Pseudovibrio sp. POLY-S9]|uniref:hypothetical protein n=1 Tax=Pseudovibrio sp. POLY-S9 TaxID=1576596 RepID=UPI00070BA32F|nr:hypothetical protein [Pseudovibrio sp. POLY-S9]
MAHSKKALSRYATSDNGGTDQTSFFVYATKDTAAEVLTDGYFDQSRTSLSKNDVIQVVAHKASADPEYLVLIVRDVPDSGNIVTSAETGANGS